MRNTATALTRDTVTDGHGAVRFTNLVAGTSDLRVTLTGFRTHEQKGLVLTATERLAVPPITLDVGGLQEVVTVEASALHAQAQSGERSGTIRADEIKDTQLRGRDFLGLRRGCREWWTRTFATRRAGIHSSERRSTGSAIS